MALQNVDMHDHGLIEFCYEHRGDFGILSEPTEQLLERLQEKAKSGDAAPASDFLTQHHGEVRKLWYNLLIDAVHALKVRDAREKAEKRHFEDDNTSKRTKARKESAYGINELFGYFSAFDAFEGVLYGSEPSYRDHVVHVVRVWLIGARVLLEEGIERLDVGLRVLGPHLSRRGSHKGGKQQQKREPAEEKPGVWHQELWGIWTIAALCHDLGYPLEKTYRINRAIDTMLRHFGQVSTGQYLYSFQEQHHALTHETLKLVSSKFVALDARPGKYTTQIQEKYHTKFARSLASLSHGIVSCLVLLQSLIYFMETDYDTAGRGELESEDARQFQIRREILRAIASHTCTEVYHLKSNTPSFLLILCDELQEWGRPTFGDMKLGQRPSDGDCKVTVNKLDLASGTVDVKVAFDTGTADEKRVQAKFREFHKLLRPAPDDDVRNIRFLWEIKDGTKNFKMTFDPTVGPFEELKCTKGGDDLPMYPDPEW